MPAGTAPTHEEAISQGLNGSGGGLLGDTWLETVRWAGVTACTGRAEGVGVRRQRSIVDVTCQDVREQQAVTAKVWRCACSPTRTSRMAMVVWVEPCSQSVCLFKPVQSVVCCLLRLYPSCVCLAWCG